MCFNTSSVPPFSVRRWCCVTQRQAPVAANIGRNDLNVRFAVAQIVLTREQFSDPTVTARIVNRRNLEFGLFIVIDHAEQPQIAHHLRRQ
jgi:hypothetical protein